MGHGCVCLTLWIVLALRGSRRCSALCHRAGIAMYASIAVIAIAVAIATSTAGCCIIAIILLNYPMCSGSSDCAIVGTCADGSNWAYRQWQAPQ